MLAIDTNLIIRYLTGDHPRQSAEARTLIDGQPVFVAKSVLLETEWVLRAGYGRAKSDIHRALVAFVGLPNIIVEDAVRVAGALDGFKAGMDFADALHLASATGCEAFVTFDKRFVKAAGKIDGPPVRAL